MIFGRKEKTYMLANVKNRYNSLPQEVKASFWFLLCSFFQRGISVITTPVFTRVMTTAEYGEFSVFYSWYGIVTIFTTLNLFFGVYVRGLVTYEDNKERFSSAMQSLTLILVTVWLVIYILLKDKFNCLLGLTTYQMLAMFIIIWTNAVYSFWSSYQRVALSYQKLVAMSMTTALLMPIVQLLLMQVMTNKVNARVFGMLLVNVLFYPPLFIMQMKKGRVFYDKNIWKYALAFNIPLIPHYLSQTLLNSADRIMIRDMIGAEQAGIYSLAYSISQIMTVFNSALMQSIEPWLYKKIKNQEINKIKTVAYPAFILIAIVNTVLIALAPEAVALFAPEEYREAIWIVPPVAMSVFFTFAYTFFAVFEFYYQKTQYITMATLVGAVLNIFLNYIFISKFGYLAAGYTTLVCYFLYALFHYLFMIKLVKENLNNEQIYDTKIIFTISVIFVLIGFLLMLTYEKIYFRYAILILICYAAYLNRKKLCQFIFTTDRKRSGL